MGEMDARVAYGLPSEVVEEIRGRFIAIAEIGLGLNGNAPVLTDARHQMKDFMQ